MAKRNKKRRSKPRARVVRTRNVSMYKPLQKQLLQSLLHPFDYKPPVISSMGSPSFQAMLFDRQIMTLSTAGCLAVTTYPLLTTSTTNLSGINVSGPITANIGGYWSAANTSYSPWAQTTPLAGLATSSACISGAMRITPVGTVTASSGILFGAIILRGTSFLNTNSPSTTLALDTAIQVASLQNGAEVRWSPCDNDDLQMKQQTTSTTPQNIISGLVIGVMGGQNAQTVLVESIYHLQCSPLATVAQIINGDVDGLTQVEADQMYSLCHQMDRHRFTARARSSNSVYHGSRKSGNV